MNIILFGPPGIGKSTIIGNLKTLGLRAIDLEDLYPNRIRFAVPSLIDGAFIGAADLNPRRKYRNAIKILLSMPQEAYESRRAQRDSKFPEKSSQQAQLISDWMKGVEYDEIVDVSGDKIAVLRHLISLMKGGSHAL